MKHFLLFFSLLTIEFGYSQNGPIDFESGGHGAGWTWTVFENDANPPVDIIANPDISGINTSSTVAKFTALQAGQPWAGCESMHGADIGNFTLNGSNAIIKVMVWKTVISDVGIKLVEPSSAAQPEIKVANTVTNQWEELTFDFTGQIGAGGALDQIVIFPDFDLAGRAQDNIIYIDNITFSGGTILPEPMSPAPTPTIPSADVISLFSDAYTDVPVDTWQAGWSVSALSDIMIAGNPTKKYTSLNYNGIETVGSPIDLTTSGMLYFHMDIWTPNSTEFKIKLVDFGGDGYGNGNDTEFEVSTNPNLEEWVNVNIPLADFTGMNQNDINQIVISSLPAGSSTVFIDNVYFSKKPTSYLSVKETPSNPKLIAYPNPSQNNWELVSDNIIENVSVYDLSGKQIYHLAFHQSNTLQIKAADFPAGIYTAKIQTTNGSNNILLVKE